MSTCTSSVQTLDIYTYADTVERNILDLAAKRGLSLYTKDHAIGTVKVTSFEMDKNRQIDSPVKNSKKQKGQKGDFIFKCVCVSSHLI